MATICPRCGGGLPNCPICNAPPKRVLPKLSVYDRVYRALYGTVNWEVQGIDISKWNGQMSFGITKTKCQYVIMRAGYGQWKDGVVDTYYRDARAQDMPVGLYWYLNIGQDVNTTATSFAEEIATHSPQLDIVLDAESTVLDPNGTLNWLKTCDTKLTALTGKKAMIYTSAGFWNSKVARSSYWAGRILWVANWTTRDTPTMPYDWSSWSHWQHCVTPETPILKGNLMWEEAGALKEGEELIGFDEKNTIRGLSLKKSEVLKNKLIKLPGIEFELEDGTKFRCALDHPVLARGINQTGTLRTNIEWVKSEDIAHKIRKGTRITLPKYFDTWNTENTWETGYLSGGLDGEGSLSWEQKGGSYRIQFAQKENPMLSTIMNISTDKKYEYTTYFGNHKPCYVLFYKGGKSKMIQMLGELQPPRLMKKFNDFGEYGSLPASSNNEIVDFRMLGEIEVAGLTTSTGTYFSDGYASHNSADGNQKAAEYGSTNGDPDMDLDRFNGTCTQFNAKYGTHIVPIGSGSIVEPPQPPGTVPEVVFVNTGEMNIRSAPNPIDATNIIGTTKLNMKWFPESIEKDQFLKEWYKCGKKVYIKKELTRIP